MLKGRTALMAILLVALIAIFPIHAEEVNSTDDLQVIQEDTLSSTYSVTGNTFDDIQNTIDNAQEGDTIELSGDYIGNGTEIKIDKSLNIKGNGNTILDANKTSSIFRVSGGNNTKITNLFLFNSGDSAIYSSNPDSFICLNCTFINNTGKCGGALYGGEAMDCTFINNSANDHGGAIFQGDAVNSTFRNNHCGWNGGALYDGDAVNCTFIGNFARIHGGAMGYSDAVNCTFISNAAGTYGGAMVYGDALSCKFINNSDGDDDYGSYFYKHGDALYFGTAINCYFEGNEMPSIGEGIEITENRTFSELGNKMFFAPAGSTIYLEKDYYLDEDYYNAGYGNHHALSITKSLTINGNGHIIDGLSNSTFYMYSPEYIIFNNVTFRNFVSYRGQFTASRAQGAFDIYGSRFSFVNCTFINIKAVTKNDCSFLLWDVDNSSFIGCTFINSSSNNHGGAVTLVECNNSEIVNCTFINCSTPKSAGAIWMESGNISSIVNCSFISNSATKSGGAIVEYQIASSSIVNCSFDSNHANNPDLSGRVVDIQTDDDEYVRMDVGSFGGAIYLGRIGSSLIDSCSFNSNLASGGAGAIYFSNVSNSQVRSSKFSNNSAFHGGTFLCENSKIGFNNLDISDSSSYRFGGAIASLSSDTTLNNCKFNNYQSSNGAGGAIYNYKGSSIIANSSFVNGRYSMYGGAISNSQSNLTILSSKFINNNASNGGAIYSVHGNVYLNDSIFNNSHASQGSAIYCMLSNSLVFTNNIFLNSTGDKFNIYSLYSNNEIVESGNHFENIYHVIIEYNGILNNKEFTAKSKVLNYVVSSTGKFLNSYDNLDSSGDNSEYVTIDLSDSGYPNASTVFGNYDDSFKIKINFQRNYDLDGELKNYEFLNIYLYDGNAPNNQMERVQDISKSFQLSMDLSFVNRTIFEYNDLIGYSGYDLPVSIINSSQSNFTTIPSSYDSRDYGYITPVRDQGDAGNCWAFAGLATLEACIKKATGITYDLSENNPKNLMALDSATGLKLGTNEGGYDLVVMGYLNSWLGPIAEKTDTYDAYSALSPIFPSIFHIQNIYFLPARENNLDNALFKKAIMDYGAVSVAFKWSNGMNHAVSLIGWVDNYNDMDSLGNYAKRAWIFKNSWGSGWDQEGYGYLSFDIPFLSDDIYSPYQAYTFVFDKYENYFKAYQYEYSGVNDYLASEGDIYYSNKFICNENKDYDEGLVAFSTYFKYPTNYTVSVYINDTLILSQSGHSEAGYYTIPFNQMIDIVAGDEFVIRVGCHNDGMNFAPVCLSSETTVANVNPEISMVSFDGKNWLDLYNLRRSSEYLFEAEEISNTCQVACIKAFTYLYNSHIAQLDVGEFDNINISENITIHLSVYGNQFYFDTLEVTNNTLITLNINGKYYYAKINDGEASIDVSFDDGGLYELSASYENNLFSSNEVQFNFTVSKGITILSAKSVSKVYGGSEKSLVTLKDDKGNLLVDTVITVTLNGKPTDYKTNSKGQVSIPISLAPNIYTATVSYAGNNKYDGATTKVKIVVKKATPKLKASKKTFKVKTKTKKYTITLKNNLGKAMKNKKVTIKINGKTYTAKTNSKGKATFKITKLKKKGSFKATIKYLGSKYYKKVTKKVKITVKK